MEVIHQLAVRLQPASGDDKPGMPISWQFVFVAVSFQILSANKLWDWRLVPAGVDKAWNSQNILVPGDREAMSTQVAVNVDGATLHGRDFHIVEPHETEVLLTVELTKDRPGKPPCARVWYEVATRKLHGTIVADKRPVSKESVLAALQCRGHEASSARKHWDHALAARCPEWWQAWAEGEVKQRRHAKRVCRRLNRLPDAGSRARDTDNGETELSKEDLLGVLQRLAELLREHQQALAACRKSSTVTLSFTDSFPYMPPQAISILERIGDQALESLRGSGSVPGGLHELCRKGARHLWDADVREAMETVRLLLEVGERKAVHGAKQLAVRAGGQLTSACGKKLEGGMRVMVRWLPGSVGATHLAYLNGHIGVLGSFDGSSRRWQVGFETFDGHLEIGAEHLHVCAQRKGPEAREKAPRREGLSCEMCLGQFLETQIRMLPCESQHSYCQDCLRKWVLTQLVPRCYRCLDEADLLTMQQGRPEPWNAVVGGEADATTMYRIGKDDIDRLECVCCFDVCSGARCIIIGLPGLSGQRCIVGRVEKNQAESFAVIYDAKGCRRQVHVACLAVDDCLSSGRTARGDPCPSKGERLSLGLGVASLGCACVVKQAMDAMFVEQLAMPFDWLVSRVEGVLYFFRHGFRDFTHYDDAQVVGEHGYTSFRSAYHAFPHHDISTGSSKGAFQRRGERLLQLVKACTEATARPLLLIRVCARSEELDSSEELYAQLRLLGGQKVFLLVVITEQRRFLGAVQHLQLSNLIFYVCQEGCRDLTDAVRFGMDYSYAAVTFGQHSLEAAKTVSPLSPALQASSLRKSLDQSHKHWLTRDSRGLSPTSDINGCFEKGPDQFFPGRFHKTTAFEPSPHYAQHLEKKVLHASGEELATLAASLAQTPQLDVNAWD
ncbi:desi2, partial [Symbiodinium sp. CCMP2456]